MFLLSRLFSFSFTSSLSQTLLILLLLPLTLDYLGPPSFLLLSLFLTLHQFTYSTLRLALKNTVGAPLIVLLNLVNPLIPSLGALAVCWLYLNTNGGGGGGVGLGGGGGKGGARGEGQQVEDRWTELLMNKLPAWYALSLRIASPVFSLLEGFATLLVSLASFFFFPKQSLFLREETPLCYFLPLLPVSMQTKMAHIGSPPPRLLNCSAESPKPT